MTQHRTRPRARRGVLLLEALTGVLLIAAIASLLILALARQSRASAKLADDRAQLRRVESALLNLHASSPTSRPADIAITRLDAPAVPGYAWYVATTGEGSRRVQLVGLAPSPVSGGER